MLLERKSWVRRSRKHARCGTWSDEVWKSAAEPIGGNREAKATARDGVGQWTIEFAPARACGMEAEAEPQHQTQVNRYAGFSRLGQRGCQCDPDIRSRPRCIECGSGATLLNLIPRDLLSLCGRAVDEVTARSPLEGGRERDVRGLPVAAARSGTIPIRHGNASLAGTAPRLMTQLAAE